MKQTKRIISMLLVAFMLVLSLPISAIAADTSSNATITGTVAEIQKYGNLTMDIKPKALYDAGYELGDVLKVTVGTNALDVPFCTSYSDVDTGSLVVRDDQTNNLLVVAINMGNFSTKYNVKAGDTVTFAMSQKAGYLKQYKTHQLTRTNVRSDYATDSIFANFRSVATTGIKPGVLYRSSSPIDNQLGRASYVDALDKAVGIKAVLNTSESNDGVKTLLAADGTAADYYKSLNDAGKVKAVNMGVDLTASEFGQKFADGIRFLSNNDGPYLIHCLEGKDRTGFICAVLESLMGAKLDEVVADYMTTYENYYGVVKGSEQYNSLAKSNIIASLTTIVCGLPKGTDITGVDLSAAAENYLKKIGLTSDEIAALKAKLSSNSVYKTPNVTGTVTQIEKYGHAVSDILISDFNNTGIKFGDMVTVIFNNGFVLQAPYLDGYFVDNGKPLVRAYPGQTNIAVCINYGKLNQIANVNVGDKFTIMLTGPKEYYNQYQVRNLKRTNNRADYSSDEVFANFRSITVGNIAKDVLYRSSSPIDNQLGRASFADNLIKAAKVNTVVNLSDSNDSINTLLTAKDFASPYYADLYKNNHVLALNMSLAFSSDEFKANIIKGLVFMSENKGPYLFHCTEGKDRTGFFAALVESLMGATKDQIVEDYMQSYINYYNVKKDTDQYNIISQDVLAMLKVIAGTDDLDKADLATGANKYLLSGGMTADQIKALKSNLSPAPVVVPTVKPTVKPTTKPSKPVVKKPVVKAKVISITAKKGSKVRTAPNGKAKVIGVAKFGTKLQLVKTQGKWYRVKFNKKDGYIPTSEAK